MAWNPLEKLPEGITKDLLDQNDEQWIKKNVIKWLNNDPSCYELIENYLTDIQIEYFKEHGSEGIEDLSNFGFFDLKNKE